MKGTTFEGEQLDLLVRNARLEEQNATLASLYVACQSLHRSLKRTDVLLSVREIVANLVGCEEYALLMSGADGTLRRIDSFGIDVIGLGRSGLMMEPIQTALQSGRPYWGANNELTVCIPLRRQGTVAGVLVLFRLLPQKFELHQADRDLLQLLEDQLATALYCAELHEKNIASKQPAS